MSVWRAAKDEFSLGWIISARDFFSPSSAINGRTVDSLAASQRRVYRRRRPNRTNECELIIYYYLARTVASHNIDGARSACTCKTGYWLRSARSITWNMRGRRNGNRKKHSEKHRRRCNDKTQAPFRHNSVSLCFPLVACAASQIVCLWGIQ